MLSSSRNPNLGLRLILAMASIAMSLIVLPAIAQPNPCIQGQSCFTNVKDILNGQRHLLRTDDLLVTGLFGNSFAGAILSTTNSAVSASRASSLGGSIDPHLDNPPILKTAAGARMFNLNHDVTLSVACAQAQQGCANGTLSLFLDPDANLPKGLPLNTLFGAQFQPNQILSTTADFTGDGYTEVVLVGPMCCGAHKLSYPIVVGAVDPETPGKGLRSSFQGSFDFPGVVPLAAAAGDFSGSGQPVIAILGIPDPGFNNPPGALGFQFYTVDPVSLDVGLPANGLASNFTLTLPEGPDAHVAAASLVAGRFGNVTHDQLAVVYAVAGGTPKLITIDFDSGGKPVQQATVDTHFPVGNSPRVVIKAGHFDWSGSFDQAVVLVATGTTSADAGSNVQLYTFDASLNPTNQEEFGMVGACHVDLAAGNFDRMQANPNPPPPNERNPNLQAALLGSDCGSNVSVTVLDVDPANGFAMSIASSFQLPSQLLPGPMNYATLVASDSQGRSLALGRPTKVVIPSRSQPSVVLGAPPMHVDYIAPARQSIPKVFNVSAVPAGFYTQYQTDESKSTQSSTQHTTSWSAGTAESLSQKIVIGLPDLDAATFQNKFSAQQAWKGNSQAVHGTSSSTQFDVSQQTGFSDQLWYTESRLNLYIYPVIGQNGCPAATPDCPESAKVPLTVQFSGVDAVTNDTVPGNTTEWYQPPWEPGNVLSYPGSLTQLQVIEPNLDQVSSDSTITWKTDGSTFLEHVSWNVNTVDSQSASFDQNYSFSDTLSVSAVTDDVITMASFKANLSLGGSFGFSTLHTAVTTLGKSTGVGIQKPGSFANPPDYEYFVTPYIFGQQRPGGVVNDLPLSTDVQTFGVLQTAFVVDPLRGDAGGWWKQAYTLAPDVALNHPTRWSIGLSNETNPNDGTCLAINPASSQIDCAALSPSDPSDPWLSDFHSMRGLFITGAEAGGQGPQLSTAIAGDQLLLQARVYNYSLTEMPPGTTVHTRFYGNLWNSTNNTPNGPSFLIGEAVTGSIPAFNTDTNHLNWQLVPIPKPFDTTQYADQYLVFWVVVWMENASGSLVGEPPGHGLRMIPGRLTSFSNVSAFEEAYSNNVGFYKSAFYVFPKSGESSTLAKRAATPFKMTPPRLSSYRVDRGERIIVDTSIITGDDAMKGGVTVLFYDDDPRKGGKVFDTEHISHLRARDSYRVSVPFRSDQCGQNKVFVVAGKGTAFETSGRSSPVIVDCGRGRTH